MQVATDQIEKDVFHGTTTRFHWGNPGPSLEKCLFCGCFVVNKKSISVHFENPGKEIVAMRIVPNKQKCWEPK